MTDPALRALLDERRPTRADARRNFDALIEAGRTAFADELDDLPPFDALAAWLRRFADYASRKKVLLEGLNRDSELLQTCRSIMYQSGEPLLRRAQELGEVRPDIAIDDAVRLVAGVAGVAFPDAEQRERVVDMALDGLRTR